MFRVTKMLPFNFNFLATYFNCVVILQLKINFFFKYLPSSGIAPCVGTIGMVQTPTLDVALLCSSRAGADLG